MGTKAFDVYGEIALKGAEKVVKDLGHTEEAAKKTSTLMSKSYSALGGVLAGVGIGLFAKSAFDAAVVAQKSQAILRSAVEATGASWDRYSASINKSIASQMALSAFDDEDLQDSLRNLVQKTGDVTEAQDLLALSTELSRGGLGDLAATTSLVGKVSQGILTPLRRMGIVLKEGATAEEALAALRQRYAGSNAAYLKTAAGAQDLFNVSLENFKEGVGESFIPAATSALKAASDLLNGFNKLSPGLKTAIVSTVLLGTTALIVVPKIAALWADLAKLGIVSTVTAGQEGVATAATLTLSGAVKTLAGALGLVAAAVAGFELGSAIAESEKGRAAIQSLADTAATAGDETEDAWTRIKAATVTGAVPLYGPIANIANGWEKMKEALHLGAYATDAATAAQAEAIPTIDASTAATQSLTEAVAGYSDMLIYATNNLTLEQTAEQRAVQDKIAVKNAQKAVNDLKKAGKTNTDEYRLAELNLIAAQNKQKDSAGVVKEASAIAATAADKSAKAARAAADAWNALQVAMGKAAAKGAAVRAMPGSQLLLARGGRPSGPESGYPATLHGTEWVIPEKSDSNALSLWRQAGEAIGAFAGMSAPVSPASNTSSMATGGNVYILADSRFTDMNKLKGQVKSWNRAGIGSGMLMARMGMQGG